MSKHTVFALPGITLDLLGVSKTWHTRPINTDHLIPTLEARECHIRNRVLLVVCLLDRNDGSICGEGEMNARETEKASKQVPNGLRVAHGTRLVWNSLRSTFRLPSNLREAVTLETTWAMRRLRLVNEGELMLRFFLQIS